MIKASALVIAGGFAAQLSRVPISSDLCKFGLVASVLLVMLPLTRRPGLAIAGFFLFATAAAAVIEARVEPGFVGDSLLTTVRIVDFTEQRGGSVVLMVSPVADHRLPPLSRVSWYEPSALPELGETWQLELRLRQPRGRSNPHVFDYEAWLFRRKVHATGYVVPGKRNRRLAGEQLSWLERVRSDFVRRAFDVAASEAPVLSAIGVGARHQITQAQWQAYAITGTSHLMAISGLHVGLAASFAFMVLSGLAGFLCRTPLITAMTGSVIAAAAYAAVSGLGVPAQRALLMLMLVASAVLRRRQVDATAILALAALVVYVFDPIAAMTPAFSLSFAAVGLLIWRARQRQPDRRRLASRLVGAVTGFTGLQSWLLAGLAPLTATIFGRIALLSIPANLFVVPVFSLLVVPLTLTALVSAPLSDNVAAVLLSVAAAAVAATERLIATLASLPAADLRIADTGLLSLGVLLPALWVLLPPGWPCRRCALLAIAAMIVHVPRPPPDECFDAHVLDVGQGLSVVVQTATSFLVFDTGASYRDGGSVAEQVVVPFLRARGARRVDRLFVSHSDNDHSGGVAEIMSAFEIGDVIAGEPSDSVAPGRQCRAGQQGTADGVDWRILHPVEPGTGNDASCVLLLSAGRHALLLTGDIETPAERDLLEREALSRVDVLVVPHHGSTTSSSPAFVRQTSPRVAIVSAGYRNRWGLPKPRVMDRWQAIGAMTLNTATDGAVSLRLCANGGLTGLTRNRYERRRLWRPADRRAP